MKTLKIKFIFTVVFAFLTLGFSYASDPAYKLTTQNLKYTGPNVLEFDIYLQHTNSNESKFAYVLGQYFFEFNPEIANGGKLTYSLVRSDLPAPLQPRNPTVSENLLRLVTNSVPAKDNLPIISNESPGTLVARMRLETSAKTFSEATLDLKPRVGPDNPFTKVMAYIDNQIIDITNREEVAADNLSGENTGTEIPKEFAIQQNYPNPFNPSTNIKFDVPVLSNVELKIYDITGREIAVLVNEQLQPGSYTYNFNGSNFASGIYFYRIKAGDPSSNSGQGILQTKRMVLIK